MNNDFGVTRDAICQRFSRVTIENYWQVASLVTPKWLFTVTHALYFIYKDKMISWTYLYNGDPYMIKDSLYTEISRWLLTMGQWVICTDSLWPSYFQWDMMCSEVNTESLLFSIIVNIIKQFPRTIIDKSCWLKWRYSGHFDGLQWNTKQEIAVFGQIVEKISEMRKYIRRIFPAIIIKRQGSFCVCAQPVRDDVTM